MIVLRILINLYFILNRAMLGPMVWIKKNGFSFAVLAVLAYLFVSLSDDESVNTAKKPTVKAPATTYSSVVQQAIRFEDGNSVFSEDLLPKMNHDEIAHYSRVFFWVLENLPNKKTHNWNFFNIHGSITPTSRFKNNFGHVCRHFSEILKVHDVQQEISGIACQKPGGGWCKLRSNSTPACNIHRKPGLGSWIDDVQRGISDIFR